MDVLGGSKRGRDGGGDGGGGERKKRKRKIQRRLGRVSVYAQEAYDRFYHL